MGIYDRDYYRREGPRYLDALIPSGQVCTWLIVINVVVWAVQIITFRDGPVQQPPEDRAHPQFEKQERAAHKEGPSLSITEMFYLDPPKVMHGQIWRLLSYAFLHDPRNWMHIFFNMLFLWWFGSELERMYGPREFLAFYLTAAILGGLGGMGFYLVTGKPTPILGASGAVTGLLVLFAMHFPRERIYIFFFLPVPIWLFVVFQVAQDTFSVLQGLRQFVPTAGIVHLAGGVFGFFYYRQHWHILGFLQTFSSWRLPRSRARLRLYRPETPEAEPVGVSTAAPSNNHLDEHLEAKLDAVLEKVARHGQGSLTEAELQILLKASEIYKRKRT